MGPLPGVYIGTVTDSADPMQHGRLRVRVPDVSAMDSWAPACLPSGNATPGWRVGDRVVVAFEGGKPGAPIVIGKLAG